MKEFLEFRKIPRLSRECVVTEKIDGTNGVICITEDGEFLVGSRKRWLSDKEDNYNFWHWCMDNKDELLNLGVGYHYGEWWGSGIQRGYNLPKGERRFSLFNTGRWVLFGTEPQRILMPNPKIEKYQEVLPKCVGLVPILYTGLFDTFLIDGLLSTMKEKGSRASPGFMNPEGIVIYHKAGNLYFKKTIEKDEEGKNFKEE